MEKGCYVKDIRPDTEVSGLFAVSKAGSGTTRNGQPYWNLTLADASGNLEAKIWHPQSAQFDDIPVGALVWAQGHAGLYREQLQLVIERFRLLADEERAAVAPVWLMPASPFPLDGMLEELRALCRAEFSHAPWRKLVHSVFDRQDLMARFRICPAAKGVHHAYIGGLLEHTLGVFRLCRHLADDYAELDRQALLAGALFHDIGKIREFSCDLVIDYTDEGHLVGHLVLGVEILAPFLAASGLEDGLQQHLRHLVLSHHGTRDFGAVQLPQTAEAFALHHADNLDAKLAQCRSLFAPMAEGGSAWTPYQKTLDRSLHRPARTPEAPAGRKRGDKRKPPPEEQCSLLSKE